MRLVDPVFYILFSIFTKSDEILDRSALRPLLLFLLVPRPKSFTVRSEAIELGRHLGEVPEVPHDQNTGTFHIQRAEKLSHNSPSCVSTF